MVFVLFCLLFLPQIPGITKMLPIFFLANHDLQGSYKTVNKEKLVTT